MALQSQQWYDLGFEMGHIIQIHTYITQTFQDIYGVSHKYSKICWKLYRRLELLKVHLTDTIARQYYPNGPMLPGFDNLPILDVFHKINTICTLGLETITKKKILEKHIVDKFSKLYESC